MQYLVKEQHYGDRQYWQGEKREIKDEQTAAQLIKAGLIAPLEKERQAPQNKAQQAPQNKAKQNQKTK